MTPGPEIIEPSVERSSNGCTVEVERRGAKYKGAWSTGYICRHGVWGWARSADAMVIGRPWGSQARTRRAPALGPLRGGWPIQHAVARFRLQEELAATRRSCLARPPKVISDAAVHLYAPSLLGPFPQPFEDMDVDMDIDMEDDEIISEPVLGKRKREDETDASATTEASTIKRARRLDDSMPPPPPVLLHPRPNPGDKTPSAHLRRARIGLCTRYQSNAMVRRQIKPLVEATQSTDA
jgi:hypothetical protein